jgi:hypothetical protein
MPTITPVAGPTIANSKTGPSPEAQASRERAINALIGQPNQEQMPVANPSNVSAEELSAIKPQTQSTEGQTTTSETPPSEKKPVETEHKENPLSSQYAILARKERALRAQVRSQQDALRAKEAEFAQREAAIKAKEAEYASNYISKDKLASDTLTTLLEAGITYDQLTQQALNSSQAADPATKLAIQRLEATVKAQQEAIDKANKQAEQSVQTQYNEALKQIKFDATKLVKSDDAFELVRETNSVNDVVEVIEKTYKEDGVILSVEEAAQAVEEVLTDRLSRYINRSKKLQQRVQPKPVENKSPAPAPKTTDKPQQQLKTLTNDLTSTRPLTAKERAILAFQGKLNK